MTTFEILIAIFMGLGPIIAFIFYNWLDKKEEEKLLKNIRERIEELEPNDKYKF